MPEAQTCSIEGLGQLRYPIPQMLIMVLRSIWRGSFATPPDVNVATGLCQRHGPVASRGWDSFAIPSPNVDIQSPICDDKWSRWHLGCSASHLPQMYDNEGATGPCQRHRLVASRGWDSFAIPSPKC